MEPYQLTEQVPTVEEYAALVAAVGWKPRQREAIEIALRHSLYAVCARVGDEVIGLGRIIGDGGLHLYLTDVVVHPRCQRQGIGTAIVAALTRWTEHFPFPNTVVAVLPTADLAPFYARHGYRAHSARSPQMSRWVNVEPT